MKISKLVVNTTLCVTLTLSITGCIQKQPSYRLGYFTVASSNNVRNLNYSIENHTKVTTRGEDCYKIGLQPNDSRLQRAMDNAIQNGINKGIDGDMLVNVRIDQQIVSKYTGFLKLFPETYNCIIVTGELVKIDTK
jgi:hypothetical protein